MQNPFSLRKSGHESRNFIGREREIKLIVESIRANGSIVITGEKGIGKSSLLRYLMAPVSSYEIYGRLEPSLITSYIDVNLFSDRLTPGRFWMYALARITEIPRLIDNPRIREIYFGLENEFSLDSIFKLFREIQASKYKFILLIDNFDDLIGGQIFEELKIYEILGKLIKDYHISFIITIRQSVKNFQKTFQDAYQRQEDFLRHFITIPLYFFSDKEIDNYLERGNLYFSKSDKEYIFSIAGGYPYLLQTAAYDLWETYEKSDIDSQIRWKITAHKLLESAHPFLTDTWQDWSPEKRKIAIIIALDNIARIVTHKEFGMDALLAALLAYSPEVFELLQSGFVVSDDAMRSGYRLRAQVMLWWLVDELISVTRPSNGENLNEWLNKQKLDGSFKGEEKTQLEKTLSGLNSMLQDGSSTLIWSSTEGFSKSLTQRLHGDSTTDAPPPEAKKKRKPKGK